MTRDEHRAKCIEAMARSICWLWFMQDIAPSGVSWTDDEISEKVDQYWQEYTDEATIHFDALHDIARVDPIEATGKMIAASDIYWQSEFPGFPTMADVEGMWRAMSAAGDLTNAPENRS